MALSEKTTCWVADTNAEGIHGTLENQLQITPVELNQAEEASIPTLRPLSAYVSDFKTITDVPDVGEL